MPKVGVKFEKGVQSNIWLSKINITHSFLSSVMEMHLFVAFLFQKSVTAIQVRGTEIYK